MTERELAGLQHKLIDKANQSKNPLSEVAENCKAYEKDGQKYEVVCKKKSDMDPKLLKWCFKLTEKNVAPYYKTNVLGWTPKVKQGDLNKNWARYLIVYDQDKNPVGFTMFRFDMDYGRSVLYCYELQIDSKYQRKGIGSFLMETLEKIANAFNMERLVLTLLNNNTEAQKFYERLEFKKDETDDDNDGYGIYSKILL